MLFWHEGCSLMPDMTPKMLEWFDSFCVHVRWLTEKAVLSRPLIGILVWSIFFLSGCAGNPEVIYLEIRALPPAVRSAPPMGDKLRVAVQPFEDSRSERGRLGAFTHFYGRETPFRPVGGELGETVAVMLIDELKSQKGWDAWLAKPGVTAPEGGPDITITGKVQDYSIKAESWLVFTAMTVNTALTVQAINAANGDAVRLDLRAARSRRTMWFDEEEAEALLNAAIHESFDQLLAKTAVDGRMLRAK